MKNHLLQDSFTKEHVFKDIVDHFVNEVKLVGRISGDKLHQLIDKQFINICVIVKKALKAQHNFNILDQRECIKYKLKTQQKETNNYLRLLKNIRDAIQKKQANKESLSGVLHAIQDKLDELYQA